MYLAYLSTGSLNAAQKTNLYSLAHACPFNDGPIVYNARVLYNLANGIVGNYNDSGCEYSSGDRKFYQNTEKENKSAENSTHVYELFPNPAIDELTILSSLEDESLTLIIKDLSNRIIINQNISIESYKAKLKLNLINGIYFVTLINKDHVQIIKKLLVSK